MERSFVSISFCIVFSLMAQHTLQAQPNPEKKQTYIVAFKPSANQAQQFTILQDKTPAGKTKSPGQVYNSRVMKKWRHALNAVSVELTPAEADALSIQPGVDFIEPSLVFKSQSTAWGLDRIDQRDLPLDGSFTRSYLAYPIHVYVVDSGIRQDHVEIADRMGDLHYDATGGIGDDCNGHGTHVASIIAGQTYGVTHTALLHNVKVLTCNAAGEAEGTSEDVIEGLEWVAANAQLPAVVNMSLGTQGWSQAVNTAVKNLIDKGITVVVAGGNFNNDACAYSPAGYDPAITVGASDISDARAAFSNDGPCVDLFAPGDAIPGAAYTSTTATITRSGTSMATAHVTGVVAELLRDHPNACPSTVATALLASTSDGRLTDVSGPNKLVCNEYAAITESQACAGANNTVYENYGQMEPCGFFFAPAGRHEGRLIVPEGVNFDLSLEQSINGSWVQVKTSKRGPGSDETIKYDGTEGTYRWRIEAVSGTGAYRFFWKKP
jgi:subtilisin family serine protease